MKKIQLWEGFSDGRFRKSTYIQALHRRSGLAVLFMAAGFLVMALLSYVVLDRNVTVSSSVMLVNNLQTDGSIEQETEKHAITEEIARDSVAIVGSLDLIDRAMVNAKTFVDTPSFARGVSIVRIDESNALRIYVTYSDGAKAAGVANELAVIACDEIQRRFTSPPISATVLDRAVAPSAKDALVKAVTKGFLGVILGLLLYCLWVFWRMVKEQKIQDYEKYCAVREISLLGHIPANGAAENALPGAAQTEATRMAKAAIRASSGGEPPCCLLITSAAAKEGRSRFASGLAGVFAENGTKTLLIDTDMRGGKIRSRLRVNAISGLSDVLEGKTPLEKVIAHASSSLDVICSTSTYVPNPSVVLDTDSMRSMLDKLKAQYDVIILEAADVNQSADASVLAGLCSGCILVARYDRTRADAMDRAVAQLRTCRAELCGMVVTQVPSLPESLRESKK